MLRQKDRFGSREIRSHDHSGDVSDLGRRNRSDHDLRTKCRLSGHYVRGNVGDRDGGTVCGSDAAARKRKSGGTDVFDVCGQDRSGDDGACICRKGEKIESAPGTSGEAYHDRIEQTGDPAEKEEFLQISKKYQVDLISLIAPTSEERIGMIVKEAEGFLYLVSSLGVTGMRNEINTDLESIVRIIRTYTKIPCAIGFGISTPEQAKKMAGVADGVIVGSAIVKLLEKYGKTAPQYIGSYIKEMKDAVKNI